MTDEHQGNAQRSFVIIYQMGKVASTSLTAALNDVQGVEAVQSHFIGGAALRAIVPTMLGAGVPDYFFEHQLGQFIENTRTTRRLNQIRAGLSDERLVIVSLARDPFQWARSSVIQDIVGYIPILEKLHHPGTGAENTSDAIVEQGLRRVLRDLAALMEREGGVDPCLRKSALGELSFRDTVFERTPDSMRFFYLFSRPVNWFWQHFETALDIRIRDMDRVGRAFEYHDENLDVVILRYEAFDDDLARFLERVGLPAPEQITAQNVSREKPHAGAVNAAFDGEDGARIAALLRDTVYARTFGYS